ncbi:dihydropyrimidinase [Ignatzschineria ureiclastica]|uniref:Dihydropyrimidinase n=1 Tax=Ignatzschineria ureiclastica TaxID=472582 RepID=A0A2U2ADY0_9GAMM|nr:dihydropyrimidinase [Ignatzschineria ureiclastica]PWD80860.1 dihydropyrimidinase [Ignatzschineria ureiclastica]GGZ94304.1 dihydropyrimidinase [Ignatzschineria ureiclastica]
MATLLIKNGTIVDIDHEYQGNILIEGEKIVAITQAELPADQVIDAKGKYILPGGIDEHTHLGSFGGLGFETTHAALVGGTTTVIDFAPMHEGETFSEAIEAHDQTAAGIASCDYAFHSMVMGGGHQGLFDDVKNLPRHGVSTIKLLMGYKGSEYYSNDETIMHCMREARKYGITTMLHCENSDMISYLTEILEKEHPEQTIDHYYSRLPITEVEATHRGIDMAILTRAPLFIVHVTLKDSMLAIRDAYNRGYPIYGETCTHYLLLDKSYLGLPNFEGAKYVCAPPIRDKVNQEPLWDALRKGWLTAASSDHCALVGGFEKKKAGYGDFAKIPNGVPGMQERMMMLWTYGVEAGRISRQKFVEITATNPAKLINLPHKGRIAVGCDADIVIWDSQYEGVISNKESYQGIDYSAFEGFKVKGRPDQVFLRGTLMAEKGQFVGDKGQGRRQYAKPYGRCFDYLKHSPEVLG